MFCLKWSYFVNSIENHLMMFRFLIVCRYSICIKAYSQDIPTQCSQPMKVQPTELTRQVKFPSQHLSAPSHVVIHKTTDTSISVQWLPPDDAARSGIKSYEVNALHVKYALYIYQCKDMLVQILWLKGMNFCGKEFC